LPGFVVLNLFLLVSSSFLLLNTKCKKNEKSKNAKMQKKSKELLPFWPEIEKIYVQKR